jgi:uncharacterized protein YkwD
MSDTATTPSIRTLRVSLLVIAIILAMTAAGGATTASAGAPNGSIDPAIEQCLLDMHNAERVSRGIAPLSADASLVQYARDWSFEMEATGFRHSDLSFPGSWRGRGENISWSQGYGAGCSNHHEGFMNSTGHRANILRASYDRIGIGIVHDPQQGSIVWVTVVFGDSDGAVGPSPTPGDPTPIPAFPPSPCTGGACDGFAAIDGDGRWRVFDVVGDEEPEDFFYGNPGDIAFMGDWNGNGTATPGLYRQNDGYIYLRNSNTQGKADYEFFFGNPGDFPLVGDWNGDGKDTVSIWRQSEGKVYVMNVLGTNGGSLGAADFSFAFGNPGDKAFTGDFDGDGRDSIGLYRSSTGFVYFRNPLSTGVASSSFFYGDPGDQILAGDWDGDGDDTVAVYRPSNRKFYVNLNNAAGTADWSAYLGAYASVVSGS